MLSANLFSFFAILTLVSGQSGERAEVTILGLELPVAMTYTAAVYDDADSIFIIGGSISDSEKSDVIYRFSVSNETLEVAGHMPAPVYTGTAIWDGENRTIHFFYGTTIFIYQIRIDNDGMVAEIKEIDGKMPLMWASSCWDKVGRKGWIHGHAPYDVTHLDFYQYELDTGVVTWLNGSSPGELSSVTLMYDSTEGNIYFLGGHDWTLPDDRATDTIYMFDPSSSVTTTLSTKLTYKTDVAHGVTGNGGVYVFDTGSYLHEGIMKYTPGGDVHYMPVPHFFEFTAIRFGAAFVPKLNRIYMFGGNDEIWWNHGTARIQYVQIYHDHE